MRRLAVLLVLVALGGCTALPTPAPEPYARRVTRRVYLPLASRVKGEVWPYVFHGFGTAPEFQQPQPPLTALSGYWWYDWSARCRDAWQVPMVWGTHVDSSLWPCNDGRPVLIGNEPERADQANATPAQMADVVHDVARGWIGPIYCCGTEARSAGWLREFRAIYEARYGRLPLAGWHVHAYTNYALAEGAWFGSVVNPALVPGVMAQVDALHAEFGGQWLLSEYGVLTGDWWHTPAQVAPVATAFRASLARRPYIVSAAWFSARAPSFHPSDLLELSGHLTDVGQAWLR